MFRSHVRPVLLALALLAPTTARGFEEAMPREPKDAQGYSDRGTTWLLRGDHDKAIRDFDEAIRLDPKLSVAFINRGVAWSEKGQHRKAIKDFDEAIQIGGFNAWLAFTSRALSWHDMGQYDKAIADFSEAIRRVPNAWTYCDRAATWLRKEEYGNAIKDYDLAVRDTPYYAEAHERKAWLLATCRLEKYRDGKTAVESAKKACELTKWKQTHYMSTLAAACAEAGQFNEAVKWQKKALADMDSALDKTEAEQARKRLKLYEESKPYRDEGK
jgi:Tfp pilus assembly protein PilF